MSMLEQHSDLILSLAKFTSALLIAFAVAPFFKRPALRATFWAGMLIILPTMIFATHGRSILSILPQLSAAPEIENDQAVAPPSEEVAMPVPLANAPTIIPAVSPTPPTTNVFETPPRALLATERKTNWVATVFFSGLAVSLLPILISLLRIRFVPKRLASGAAMDVWASIRPHEAAPFPLYFTSSPSAPFTAGLIRAAVLLPESAAAWSLRRLRSTLHHEAAHISRRDPLVRMFASIVRAVFWFHPLVWLAHRHLVSAQEEACDEIALAAGIPADEYAEDLLETAKHSQGILGFGLGMARWSQLGSRVRIILANRQIESKPLNMKTIAIVTLSIAAGTFGLSSLGFSETPEAAETPDKPVEKRADGYPEATPVPGKEGFVFSPHNNRIVDVRDVPPGTLVSDPFYPPAKRKFFRLPREGGNAQQGNQAVLEKELDARLLRQHIDAIEAEKITLESQIGSLMKYKDEQLLVYASGLDLPDNIIKALYPQYLALKREIVGLKASGIGDAHPTVVSQNRMLDALIKDLDEGVVNLRTRLQGQLDMTKARLERAEIEVPEAGNDAAGSEIAAKLREIIIPSIDFEDTALEEAIDFLRLRTAELDSQEPDPEDKGFNIVLHLPEGMVMPRIPSLRLRNVPIEAALKYICDLTAMTYAVDPFAVILTPRAKAEEPKAGGEIIVDVLEVGEIQIEGKKLDDAEVTEMFKAIVKEFPNQAVRIRGDKKTTYQNIVRVIDLCQKAGLWNISFATVTSNGDANSGAVAKLTEDEITAKLRRIIIPNIDFEDTTLEEAIDFLRFRASELDVAEKDPVKKGINFVIRKPLLANGAGDDAAGEPRIAELRLRNVPLSVALKYICDATKMTYKVDDFAVTIVPIADAGEDLYTRTFRIPPGFAATLGAGADGGEIPIIELLKKAGVQFPEGSSAKLDDASGTLLVTNTPAELGKIEQLVEAANKK